MIKKKKKKKKKKKGVSLSLSVVSLSRVVFLFIIMWTFFILAIMRMLSSLFEDVGET